MTRYIILLRGVNVSGKHKVPMALLRSALEKAEFEAVQTYIQSGNILLSSDLSAPEVAEKVGQVLQSEFGFKVPIWVKQCQEWEALMAANPFASAEEKYVYCTFLMNKATVAELSVESKDRFVIHEDMVYIHCPGGYGKTKLNTLFFERSLQTIATTRNWKTIKKLYTLAKSINQ